MTIQVGQCGNQIGNQFWNLLLQEHENQIESDHDAMSSFFRVAPQRGGLHEIKARAVLVDMECGPLLETTRSPIGNLFDETQYIMDVYGAGNNFGQGFVEYGPKYQEKLLESIRRIVEPCESLQTFMVTHSVGGGTGSGVGSYMFGLLEDYYPRTQRFSTCVFPSTNSSVVTSPYNSMLAAAELIEHAHCVFPLHNHCLESFILREAQFNTNSTQLSSSFRASTPSSSSSSSLAGRRAGGCGGTTSLPGRKERGFDEMNLVAARMLCHLTSGARFHGELNLDMNEIYTNLVPFQRVPFLSSAMSLRRPSTMLSSSSNAHVAMSTSSSATSRRSALPSHSFPASSSTSSLGSHRNSRTVEAAVPTLSNVRRSLLDVVTNIGQLSCSVGGDPPDSSSAALRPTSLQRTPLHNRPPLPHTPPPSRPALSLASLFLGRGPIMLSDFIQSIAAAQQHVRYPTWNPEASKIGLCAVADHGQESSALGVFNSTSFGQVLQVEKDSLMTLYRRKAMLHHYTPYLSPESIDHSVSVVSDTIAAYAELETYETYPQHATSC